jgi:hypothetical protein
VDSSGKPDILIFHVRAELKQRFATEYKKRGMYFFAMNPMKVPSAQNSVLIHDVR